MGLILLTGWLGFLSGLFYPSIMGLRGASLGGSLSMGIILLGFLSRSRLDADQRPKWGIVMLTALFSAAITAFLIRVMDVDIDNKHYEFGPPPYLVLESPLSIFGIAWAYSLSLYVIYIYRRSSYLRAFLLAGLAGLACTILRAALSPSFRPAEASITSLFSGIPFCLAWLGAVALFDPAWTRKRWLRLRGLTPQP
ncbi:MAG TPA: hypothetical protein DCZ95_17580 [Verrucomicrobia bacterium]|nr:MAG: hypothetical protein A2X46_17650 [Lentisphaerae bacterium GWF2_57_35]HBA85898.1 hypothetical protein [Verrucomicrobiota bacterium]